MSAEARSTEPVQGTRPPREITVVRVLLVLTGFGSVVNGLLEQAPGDAVSTKVFGWFLVAFGLACWWLTFRLRTPAPRRRTEVLALVALLVAVRMYQAIRFASAAPLAGLILPVLVYWRLNKPAARAWLRTGVHSGGTGRRVAALGAVGITVAALVVLTGAGAVVAALPCSFPTPAVGALDNNSLGATGGQPTGSVAATDGTRLSYYAYLPANPVASLVFYHGSGANSAAGYLPMGQALADRFHIATYLVDIRGHGTSGGPRGDTPTPDQVWQDTATMVSFVHQQHPGLPEFVGGHSAGAGVVLNSMSRINDLVSGYVLVAPDFGLHANTTLASNASNFATVCQRAFVVNALSNGLLDGHTEAVGFAYTQSEISSANLVSRYTVNMALAQNPDNSAADLRADTRPLGVWIGAQDEVFDPAKVLDYARQAGNARPLTTTVVPGVNHLGILNSVADQLGPWLDQRVRS